MIQRIFHITVFLSLLSGSLFAQHNHELMVQGELYLTDGAQVFVEGDVHIESSNGKLANSGTLQLQGNLIKKNGAQFQSNFQGLSSGKVVFQNTIALDEEQFIEGQFTQSEAFYDLVINNQRPTDPVVYLKDGDIGISNVLTLQRGRLRTGDFSTNPIGHTVHIYNGNPEAIQGHILGNEQDAYIEGRLSRLLTGNSTYDFPIGRSGNNYGSQPLSIALQGGGPNQITAHFESGKMTPVGTFTTCDIGTPPDDTDNPDGLADNLSVDCVRGQWVLDGSNPNSIYTLSMYPSQDLLNECNGVKDYIGLDGNLIDMCPTTDFVAHDLQAYGVFDLPSVTNVFFLSVELDDFIARGDLENTRIHLDWSTVSEQDNAGFELLRSEDGQAFKSIAWIAGQGTTNDVHTYHYEDENVQPNKLYYYQLRMVSHDGKTQFSDIAAGLIELDQVTLMPLFPNPVNLHNPRVYVPAFADGRLSVELFDVHGQLLFSGDFDVVEGLNRLRFLPVDIPTGVYQVIMQDEVYTRRSELVVIR
ncbi:MAG: T9SS type A sorting domain-containing protein [Bacteroidota bacterium]